MKKPVFENEKVIKEKEAKLNKQHIKALKQTQN